MTDVTDNSKHLLSRAWLVKTGPLAHCGVRIWLKGINDGKVVVEVDGLLCCALNSLIKTYCLCISLTIRGSCKCTDKCISTKKNYTCGCYRAECQETQQPVLWMLLARTKSTTVFWHKTKFFLALNEIKMISFKGPQISSQRIAVPDTELIIFRWH